MGHLKLTREISNSTSFENDELTFSICSDLPYTRYSSEYGEYDEILRIDEEAIDFTRLNSGAMAFLDNHDADHQIGVVTRTWIADNKLYAAVKFSTSPEVKQIVEDIKNGIRTNCSIGYQINDYHFETIEGRKSMIVDSYLIYEASLVSIPADADVGYNRSMDTTMNNEDDKKEEVAEVKEETAKVEETAEATTEANPDEISADEKIAALEKRIAELEAAANTSEATTEEEPKEEEKPVEETKECDEDEEEEIRSLGDMVNQRAIADEYIKNHRSLTEFKEAIKKENNKNLKANNNMEKFSLRKAIANACGEISDENAAFERSVIDENKRKFNSTAAIVVTKDQLRAMPDGSESLNQVQYRPDQYAQNLRPQNVIAKTGARVVNVDGADISFNVCPSGLNAGFVGVNGEIPSADMSWELKNMTPHKLGCYVTISKKALLQDKPDVENLILDDITRALDQCKDEAIICGDGTNNKPVGIYATSGINEVTLPATWTLSTALAFEKPIRDSNDFSEDLKWVMNSNMYYKLAATPKSAKEQNAFLIDDDRKMLGYDCIICNALPTSGIILGNFNELLVTEFNAMEVSVETDATLARRQAREVQAFECMDCLVRRKKSFTKGA